MPRFRNTMQVGLPRCYRRLAWYDYAGKFTVVIAYNADSYGRPVQDSQLMQKSTINDVAAMAGVSIRTVSRVVNNERNVRESTREAVQKFVAELNDRPNPSARSLTGRRSCLIALLYDDPSLYENPGTDYVVNLQQGALMDAAATLGVPLPEARFFPTGGISAELAPACLALNNVTCIRGTWIAPTGMLAAGDFAGIARRAADAARLTA